VDHGRGSELPDEHTDHDGGKDNTHQERTKDVHRPSCAGRLTPDFYGVRPR
jgi:hypothetical protein